MDIKGTVLQRKQLENASCVLVTLVIQTTQLENFVITARITSSSLRNVSYLQMYLANEEDEVSFNDCNIVNTFRLTRLNLAEDSNVHLV